MSTRREVLVFGASGNFGRRLCARLAGADAELVLAGRSPGLVPFPDGPAALVARRRPFLVIDAGGLAETDDSIVPACIAAGAHYIDLSADRRHVAAIARHDTAAASAGCAVIAGASSVPGLTAAIARHLAKGLDSVERVETTLIAALSGVTGRGVLSLVLVHLGRPFRGWNGACRTAATGWGTWRRARLSVPGRRPLAKLAGAWGVPDHDLLPGLLPGRPSIRFETGLESDLINRLVALLARLPLRPSAGLAAAVLRRLSRLGGGRSGLSLSLTGLDGGHAETRSLTLLAESHRGAGLPVVAAALLAERLLESGLPPGARSAAGLLGLADFAPDFTRLGIATAQTAAPARPLWPTALGAGFTAMPEPVRRLHAGLRGAEWRGRTVVIPPATAAAALIARLLRLPKPGGDHPARVRLDVDSAGETWHRRFGPGRFSTRLRPGRNPDEVTESFGPFHFGLRLDADAAGFSMHLMRWRLGPLPLPRALAPRVTARAGGDVRYRFLVDIRLPLIGRLIGYEGHLDPP